MAVRIQVLGPVCVWRDGEPLDLGPPGQRAAFGLLALAGGRPVPGDEFVAGVWYGRPPPPSAPNVLQTYVKHLRQRLEPERPPRVRSSVVRRVGDGYALHVPESTVDVLEFRRGAALAAELQRRGRLDAAAATLGDALGMWRGSPLADLPGLADHPKVLALAGERIAALARYGEVMLTAGHAADGLAALEEVAAAHPLDEAAQARLIRAYHAAGRRGQAFGRYHEVRRRLVDELGVEPGPELRAAHADLLRGDGRGRVAAPPPTEHSIPAQLPADVSGFAGRTAELATLDRALADVGEPAQQRTSSVCVLTGPAGAGKTSLAVRWAYRAARRFPDGQLYVNLRGFDPGGSATAPAEVLRWFLDALGVPAERIPIDLDARAATYRSLLAARRMLVVLDNARDTAQVRPLLPGGPECAVVVTSRDQLAGLIAAEGATPVPVHPLTTTDAAELLLRRLGPDRTAAEPQAAAEILAWCAGLPLAIVIIAAFAATRRTLPLAALADELRLAHGRLGALATGDPGTDLREVFSWSYRALTPAAARLFRLLGLHPGPDISTAAAASLAGQPMAWAQATLAELVQVSLAEQPAAGRYALHDLLRAYATDLAERAEAGQRRRAATRRMLGHYLRSGYAADRWLNPGRVPITLAARPAGVTPERPTDYPAALAWFTTERPVLLAAVDRAVAGGYDAEAWGLAWVVSGFLDRLGYWQDLLSTQDAATAAARRAGDALAEARAHRMFARACTRLGRLTEAHDRLRQALRLYRRAGDRTGQADTHLNLALAWQRQGEHASALDHAREALDLFPADDALGRARAGSATGWYHALLHDHQQALAYCRPALRQFERLGDRNDQASVLHSLGYTYHHIGDLDQAAACYRRAVEILRELGDRHLEALVLTSLGDTHRGAGDAPAARTAWRRALDVLADIDQPAAEEVRGRLAALTL